MINQSGQLSQVWRRLQLAFSAGVMTLFGQDKIQARIFEGETLDNILRPEPYGFSHHPLPGSIAYLVFPAGDRSAGIALIVGDQKYILQLEKGEVAIYDHTGNFVKIGTGGVITAKASTKVIADAPLFETTGNAKVAGNLEVYGNTITSGNNTTGGDNTTAGNSVTSGQTMSSGGYAGGGGGAAQVNGELNINGDLNIIGEISATNYDIHIHTDSVGGDTTPPQ